MTIDRDFVDRVASQLESVGFKCFKPSTSIEDGEMFRYTIECRGEGRWELGYSRNPVRGDIKVSNYDDDDETTIQCDDCYISFEELATVEDYPSGRIEMELIGKEHSVVTSSLKDNLWGSDKHLEFETLR